MKSQYVLSGPQPLQPIPNTSLGRHLYDCLRSHENKVAQIDAVTGERRTYADILSQSLSIADYLHSRGVRCGDVVGICSENTLDFILPVIGSYFIGATVAPLNPNYTERELHHALNISKPCTVFTSEQPCERLDNIASQLEFVKEVIVFGLYNKKFQNLTPFEKLLCSKASGFEPLEVDHHNMTAVILCSSGTTGLPKGVMLTHRNILYIFGYNADYRFGDFRSEDTLLALLPMFHAFMFLVQLTAIVVGMKTVVMKRFQEELLLESVQNHQVTVMHVVPPIIVFLAKSGLVDKYKTSSLRDVLCGAAPLKEDIERMAAERLGLRQIRQGYGMTEATLATTMMPTNKTKRGSSGVLVPGMQCKVIDPETGNVLGPHKKGELCFRGPGIMKGYCGNIQATSATIDEDGFLHSGDAGYYDEEGFFYIVDRIKELIKYKGYQVPPAELEAVLLTHPEIKEAGVIGIPDEIAGELPMAFVVKQPGARITKDEIIKFVAGQVSPQKRLHGGVVFIDCIPKTPSGKILRRELRNFLKSKL